MRAVNIKLTPEGGRYYRARSFWFLITLLAALPVVSLVLLAVLNPFWFRESFAEWLHDTMDEFNKWRNYTQYKIYLGMDPKIWHSLKD